MERATRERLTGAVILVAALAIVVPEMLSGPGDHQRVAREAVADTGPPLTTYDLAIDPSAPGASRQQQLSGAAAPSDAIAQAVPPPVTMSAPPAAADTASPDDEPETSAPAEANETPAGQGTVARVTPPAATAPAAATGRGTTASASSPAAMPAASAARPANTASGSWWVQLGSFSSAQNAQALARKLRAAGFTIDVSVVRTGGRELHRVRAGPEKDRAAATALRTRLAAAGQQGTLVAP